MSAQESISLEQIAAELRVVDGDRKHAAGEVWAAKGRVVANRFGEVVEAFLSTGTIAGAAEKTGLSRYTLNRYYFSNPEFCNLLRCANESIFLEATKSLRDNQATFIQKAQNLAQDALNEMETLLHESESEHIRFRVAKDLLDRDPLQRAVSTTRTHQTAVNVTIEAKTLELAMQAAGELERCIPVTPTEGSSAPLNAKSLEQKEIE